MMSILPAVESINRALWEICEYEDHRYAWENARLFLCYAKRLQLVLNQLTRSTLPESLPAAAQTSLRGIDGELKEAVKVLLFYERKSKIFVLINCHLLCKSLHQSTVAIGGYLALLDTALQDNPDLQKNVSNLSRDMKLAQFRVTENEDRLHCTLEKEGKGRQTSKAVQSAIVMDLARALGIDANNHFELSEQVKHLKIDGEHSNSVSERRVLTSLERIVNNWLIQPDVLTQNLDLDFEDDQHISPFKNFLCPLTKEVMKNPVVLESSQTYERTAIEYWFERCLDDGREATCPVSGQVLKSLELKPNIGLAGAIEEWTNRNIEIHIKMAVQYLTEDPLPVDRIEQAVDGVYKISENHPSSWYKVRNAGIVLLIVKGLRNCSKGIPSLLRSKVLRTLLSMAKDEESKKIMIEEGITRLAIHSLTGNSEEEREYAVKLLLEFSNDEAYCLKLALEKGALVLLSSMVNNLEHPTLSNLAEEVLKQMEKVDDNVKHLAAAGRFEPLLARLCEGPDNIKIEMASIVGVMTLVNSSKEQIARRSSSVLVKLLSNPEGREPSLRALFNLSSLAKNAPILVDAALLPALVDILFGNQDASVEQKELSASVIANVVKNPGHWELAHADRAGHLMESESIVFNLVGLLSLSSPRFEVSILQTLHGIASSPLASECVIAHIKSGDGLKVILTFLEHQELEHRIYSFGLVRILSEKSSEDLAEELKSSNRLFMLKEKILDNQSTDGERADAASILANLTLADSEVRTFLGADFVRWITAALKKQLCNSSGRTSYPASSMVEGLLGILLHFIRCSDSQSASFIRELQLMTVFSEQLLVPTIPKVKQLAAIGMKYLSMSRTTLAARDEEPQPPHGLCSHFVFICGKASLASSTCPIHNAKCEEDSQFCLLKSNCVRLLVDLLKDNDTGIQIAAVEALSTLVLDTSSGFKRAVDELENLHVVDEMIMLFSEVRPGDLQEKTLWMIERMLRVENLAHRQSLNQTLVRALVEAIKHGNATTKRYAQDALTNLKQISGISGQTSSQNRGRG